MYLVLPHPTTIFVMKMLFALYLAQALPPICEQILASMREKRLAPMFEQRLLAS